MITETSEPAKAKDARYWANIVYSEECRGYWEHDDRYTLCGLSTPHAHYGPNIVVAKRTLVPGVVWHESVR